MQADISPPAPTPTPDMAEDKVVFFQEVEAFLREHPTIKQESTLFHRAVQNGRLGKTMRARARRDRLNMEKVRAYMAEQRQIVGLQEYSSEAFPDPDLDEAEDEIVMP